MSSYEATGRRAGAPEFAPLGGPRINGSVRASSVFPDFDARRAGDTQATAAEPAASAPSAIEQAQHASYAAGFADGQAAAQAEFANGAAAFGNAVEEVARFRGALIERYERELLELALGVARKVVQRELAEHPEHWLGMIREAVLAALDRETIRIRVGTVLHHYLLENLPRLRALLEDVKELDLVEDVSLDETGCVIESRYADLDLGVDVQMSAIRAALTGSDGV
jgi:flagellar assembly protein FliH